MCFQLGEDPCMGLLRDCKTYFRQPSFQAVVPSVALPLMQLAMLLRQDTITAYSVLVVHRSVTPCQ